jgi:hypothetical protein
MDYEYTLYTKLKEHDKKEPKPPKLCGVELMTTATPEGIIKHCSEYQINCLGVLNGEAGGLFDTGHKNNSSVLNDTWSGIIQTKYLATQKKQKLKLSSALVAFLQPKIAEGIFIGGGKKLRYSGFLARCLFNFVASHQGYRSFSKFDPDASKSEEFDARIIELLKLTAQKNLE